MAWLGTPWKQNACERGVGCDCITFALSMWNEVHGTDFDMPTGYVPFSCRFKAESVDDAIAVTDAMKPLGWLFDIRKYPSMDECVACHGDIVISLLGPNHGFGHVGVLAGIQQYQADCLRGVYATPVDAIKGPVILLQPRAE